MIFVWTFHQQVTTTPGTGTISKWRWPRLDPAHLPPMAPVKRTRPPPGALARLTQPLSGAPTKQTRPPSWAPTVLVSHPPGAPSTQVRPPSGAPTGLVRPLSGAATKRTRPLSGAPVKRVWLPSARPLAGNAGQLVLNQARAHQRLYPCPPWAERHARQLSARLGPRRKQTQPWSGTISYQLGKPELQKILNANDSWWPFFLDLPHVVCQSLVCLNRTYINSKYLTMNECIWLTYPQHHS